MICNAADEERERERLYPNTKEDQQDDFHKPSLALLEESFDGHDGRGNNCNRARKLHGLIQQPFGRNKQRSQLL